MRHNEVSFSSARRRQITLNVLLSILAMIVILALLNFLGLRHYFRWHLDSRDSFTLSPMTVESLKGLKQDVTVTVLFKNGTSLYSSIDNLLKEYESVSPHLKVERVDYTRKPQLAESVKNKYSLTLPSLDSKTYFRDLVIFETKGKVPRVIYEKEFSDYNVDAIVSGKEQNVKRISFKGEMLFTSAIASLMEEGKRTAYFSAGHREYDPENADVDIGYSKFAEIFAQNYVEVKKLNIWAEGPIPEDCSLLVIAGASSPLLKEESAKVETFLKGGGSLMLLLPERGQTGLDDVFKNWGVEVRDQLVYDPISSWNLNLIVTNFNSQSPISRPLFGSLLQSPMMRAVSEDEQSGKAAADAPQVVELFRSSTGGYLVDKDAEGKLKRTNKDEPGKEYGMAVSVEKGALQGVISGRGTTRIVIIGNSMLFENRWIDSAFGNRDLAVLSINWLLDRSQLMGGIGPRAVTEYQLNLSDTQFNLLLWIMLAILPGIVLVLGLVVWAHRRN